MNKSPSAIKTTIERSIQAMKLKDSLRIGHMRAEARLVGGLRCEVRAGEWSLLQDMPEAGGGEGSAPSPGDFLRMSLGGCAVIGYAMWFAREEVPYEDIRVEVEGEVDHAATFGMTDAVQPGHHELRVRVHVVSPAPREEVERVLALADCYSPNLYELTCPIPVHRELELSAPVAPQAVAR